RERFGGEEEADLRDVGNDPGGREHQREGGQREQRLRAQLLEGEDGRLGAFNPDPHAGEERALDVREPPEQRGTQTDQGNHGGKQDERASQPGTARDLSLTSGFFATARSRAMRAIAERLFRHRPSWPSTSRSRDGSKALQLASYMPAMIARICLSKARVYGSSAAAKSGAVTARRSSPPAIFTGSPTRKMFICGTARATNPSAVSVRNKAATTGPPTWIASKKTELPIMVTDASS